MTNEVMDDATLSKLKKFAFDMHNFDDETYVDPNEELEPPPPTFTEEELEAARQEGYAKGKQEGLAEAKASRDQEIAQILQNISGQTGQFFEAENAREKIYELEAVKLSHQIFQKLFPFFQEKHGLEELKTIISTTLSKNQGQAKIMIQVHPDAVSAIDEHLKTLGEDTKFTVSGDETLEPMSCALKWTDGGALRHAGNLAEQISTLMEEALAANGGSLHDSEEEESAQPEGEAEAETPPQPEQPEQEDPTEAPDDTPNEAEMEIKDDG